MCGTSGKAYLLANAGNVRDASLLLELGRVPGGGHGKPLQYSCLENSIDRGAWQATVHRVKKSQTGLKQLSTQAYCDHIPCAPSLMWMNGLCSSEGQAPPLLPVPSYLLADVAA